MDRRDLLKTGGMAALGIAAGGCAGRAPRTGPPRPYVNLARVEASWDRIIRTTVGLRPHRASGFDLRAERLDAKTIIHNYGHGGAGHSLGWGTGQLAAELALEHDSRRAAVIGCGTVGLTATRQLQRRGFDVTIYAKSVPPYTTSNMALAGFTPTSGLLAGRRTPAWEVQFRRAAQIGYEQLQLLMGRGYGVSWINNYRFADEPPPPPRPRAADEPPPLRPPATQLGSVLLQPGEHPFPSRYAIREPFLRIEPGIYLDRLVRDVMEFGARIEIRDFTTRNDLMALREPLIINCTGLGARDLFNDDELTPLKGQLTMLVSQPEVNYGTFGGIPGRARGAFYHMMPRHDGIVLGGTQQRGEWSLEPDEEARRRVVDTHIELFNGMRAPDRSVRLTAAAASEVPSAVPSVESFFGLES